MVRAAADNLTGGPESAIAFTPVPTFWSNQHEVKIKAAGFPALAHQYVVVDKDEEAARLVVEGYAGGELVAVITFNAARAFLAYRKCLAPAAPPDTAASAVPVGS